MMRSYRGHRGYRGVMALLALGAGLSTAACESERSITDVSSRPEYVWSYSGNWQQIVRRLAPVFGELRVELIGTSGGTVRAGGHTLMVPKNASSEPAYFVMRVVPGDYIHVQLYAFSSKTGKRIEQFPIPVQLSLSYADAQVDDLSKLVVEYLVDGEIDGPREALTGGVLDTTNKTLTVLLYHFSGYAMAID